MLSAYVRHESGCAEPAVAPIWVKMLGSVPSQVGEGRQSRPLTPSPAIDAGTCPDVSAR